MEAAPTRAPGGWQVKLGIRLGTWKGLSLPEQFKRIAALGFKYVNADIGRFTPEDFKRQEAREAIVVFRDPGLVSCQMGTHTLYCVAVSDC